MLKVRLEPFDIDIIKKAYKHRVMPTRVRLRSHFDMIEDHLQFFAINRLDLIYSKYIMANDEISPMLVLSPSDIRDNYINHGITEVFSGCLRIKSLGLSESQMFRFVLHGFDYHIFVFKHENRGFVGAAI